MITISVSPQTPAHMLILSKALAEMLGAEAQPVATAEVEVKKPRKPAPTPVAVVTAPEVTAPAEPVAASPSKTVTLEEVRAKLAALSQAGKTAEVKTLISQFGAGKLTDLAADKYAEVLTAAEAL